MSETLKILFDLVSPAKLPWGMSGSQMASFKWFKTFLHC